MSETVETPFTTGANDAVAQNIVAPSNTSNPTFIAVPAPTGKYSDEDIARARQQEKDKLYPQIEELKSKAARLEELENARAEAEAARLAAEAESARREAEAEMSAKELVEQRTQEIIARLEEESNARKQAEALLIREREYQELLNYRSQRLGEAQEQIIPELVDLVAGNSIAEIDASIDGLIQRSAAILGSVAAATQSARSDLQGTRATLPPAGPLDTQPGNIQFTPEQISAMSANEYAQYRSRLLGSAASAGGKGLFG
jgi:hypothetical protein